MALDARTYVVVDGDDKVTSSGLSSPAANAKNPWKIATEKCLQVVTPKDSNGQSIPFKYGDPTVIGFNMSIFHNDLEEELSKWPSFKLKTSRSKDLYAYRSAVQSANAIDMPGLLSDLVRNIISFAAV